ncbi:OmpA family protein [Paraglaciecola chathamensis]|uniref:OmpA family protein n=1 Tax=Paraglaciecola chathamensis TaxID=368405 RepID=A0ABS0WEP3_9ALTE|nr:OmpA family protein [Paraglaciecola chathamensis]MBJ2136917.1 OmpA family protein [Paraglaciecola chathamensis]MDO6839403.1 OmpA family protein [Paraglaciecola chathamensis]
MKKTMTAMGILLAFTSGAFAQSAPVGDKWVGGFGEYYKTDGELDGAPTFYDDGVGFGAELGFRFKPQWAARLEWSHLNIDQTGGLGDESGNRFGVDAMYFLPDDLMYVFAGVKHLDLADSSRLANVGLGKHWNINDKWRVITEIAAYHDFGEAYNDVSAKIGLAYSFGATSAPATRDSDSDGVNNSMDKCPGTAPGVQVDAMGCALAATAVEADSDNDGVVDSQDKCANTPSSDKVDATGCSIFAEVEVEETLRILFANNSSEIANRANSDIRDFAAFMKRFPSTDTVIEGYASAPGESDYNQWLSEERAKAVRMVLIEDYDIKPARITAVGYGESKLLDAPTAKEANKINRRIVARVSASKREKVTK